MPENQKGNIGGSGVSGSATSTGADTLTDQDVATRYGLSEDQVHAFCRDFNIPKVGDHYAIAPTMLPQLENWAKDKGFGAGR